MPREGLRTRPPKTFVVSAVEGRQLKMSEGGDQKIDQYQWCTITVGKIETVNLTLVLGSEIEKRR